MSDLTTHALKELPPAKWVISIHGIRTRGVWQKQLNRHLNNANLKHDPFDYGFFGVLRFLTASSREKQITSFLNRYTNHVNRCGERPCIIAHSLGSYVVCRAMEKYPEVKFDRMILCGSIVRQNYSWSARIPVQAYRVLNDYGRRDVWAAAAAWFVADAGASGKRGFIDNAKDQLLQRCHPEFRHSDYFYDLNFEKSWIPFLMGRDPEAIGAAQRQPVNWRFAITRVTLLLLISFFVWIAILTFPALRHGLRRIVDPAIAMWQARNRKSLSCSCPDVISDLQTYIEGEFAASRRGDRDGRHDPWTEAQMRVALDGPTREDEDLVRWFDMKASVTGAWRQHPNSKVDHIGATAWILLSYSRMNRQPKDSIIVFLLTNQHSAGWWPQYPALDQDRNASTYATAMSTWALHELLRRDLISPTKKERVANAVRVGGEWLIAHSVPQKPGRWSDYESSDYPLVSLGLSGLVVHVLHVVHDKALPSSIDESWMSSLPPDLPGINEQSPSSFPVTLTPSGAFTDSTHNFAFPWIVIATFDAYPRGTTQQRAHAWRIFAQIAERRNDIRRGVQNMPWLAAEALMSLRYSAGDHIL